MRPLDPRLLRRARPVRFLLGIDAMLGVLAALLVLVQAVLLARVTARAFEGAGLPELTTQLLALVTVVVARSWLVWGFEVAGRRAAVDVLSQLRLDVVERRLHDRPAALDGARSAEIAAAAVTGVDALETTFARYLPQVVLALVVPVAVLAFVAAIDLVAAGVMLLTLPLVPLFMWLVGRYTERQTRARWQALVLLSTHFLDVVRGLPTLRAFNRGRVQTQRIAEVSEQYRRTTMSTLRVAFLSGTVLELAATLGIALVAVTVGVRLVDGRIGFEPALTVLVLAPELYLPLRNLAAQFHASADTRAATDRLLDLVEEPAGPSSGAAAPPSPRAVTIAMDRVAFAYPEREGSVLRGVDLELVPGETVALVGPSGAGKSTIVALLLGFARPYGREDHDWLRRPRRLRSPRLEGTVRVGAAAPHALPRHDRRQHPPRRTRCKRRARPRAQPSSPEQICSSQACPAVTRRSSGTEAGSFRRAKDAASRLRARFSAMPRS